MSDANFQKGFNRQEQCLRPSLRPHGSHNSAEHVSKKAQLSSVLSCRFYDGRLARSLRNIFLSHESLFLARGGDLRPDIAASCTSIRQFDDAITRVTFGEELCP